MRIIRHGRDHPEWKKHVICGPTKVGDMKQRPADPAFGIEAAKKVLPWERAVTRG